MNDVLGAIQPGDCTGVLVFPRLQIQNANAVPAPLHWGPPAPPALLGWAHALARQLADRVPQGFAGVGMVCHRCEPQVFRPPGRFHRVFRLARHPLRADGSTPGMVEEGRIHLEVSLILPVRDYVPEDDVPALLAAADQTLAQLRLAGGSFLPRRGGKRYQTAWYALPGYGEGDDQAYRKLRRTLLPGFALVQRQDLLAEHLQQLRATHAASPKAGQTGAPNGLDALLDLVALHQAPARTQEAPDLADRSHDESSADSQGDPPGDNPASPGPARNVAWVYRPKPGWLVPLTVGYGALSPLLPAGSVRGARNAQAPLRFVENLYSLGQWVSPHRIDTLDQLIWTPQTDEEAGLYLSTNRYRPAGAITDPAELAPESPAASPISQA